MMFLFILRCENSLIADLLSRQRLSRWVTDVLWTGILPMIPTMKVSLCKYIWYVLITVVNKLNGTDLAIFCILYVGYLGMLFFRRWWPDIECSDVFIFINWLERHHGIYHYNLLNYNPVLYMTMSRMVMYKVNAKILSYTMILL